MQRRKRGGLGGGVTSQQMGWCDVFGAGDLHEYELQIAQITWRSKAVRNLECQSHLADIWRDIITLRTWKWAGLNCMGREPQNKQWHCFGNNCDKWAWPRKPRMAHINAVTFFQCVLPFQKYAYEA